MLFSLILNLNGISHCTNNLLINLFLLVIYFLANFWQGCNLGIFFPGYCCMHFTNLIITLHFVLEILSMFLWIISLTHTTFLEMVSSYCKFNPHKCFAGIDQYYSYPLESQIKGITPIALVWI